MASAASWLITASASASPAIPTIPGDIVAPHVAETCFRLGVGGAVVNPEAPAGWDLILAATLYNNGVVVSFADEDILEAVVWRGDDRANLFFPQVEWISAPAGQFRLSVRAADTTAIEPGRYSMRVGVTVRGVRLLAYDGGLEILPAPGSDAPRVPYVTSRDLEFYYPPLGTFQDFGVDQTGFSEQRVNASDELDRMLVERYAPRAGFVKVRNSSFDPILGYDVPDPSIVPPTKRQVTDWLAAGGLAKERKLVEIVARLAVALVLARQETDGPNAYRQEAQAMRDRAMLLWKTYAAQIDSGSDGIPDWLIDRDATSLPAGAAP